MNFRINARNCGAVMELYRNPSSTFNSVASREAHRTSLRCIFHATCDRSQARSMSAANVLEYRGMKWDFR